MLHEQIGNGQIIWHTQGHTCTTLDNAGEAFVVGHIWRRFSMHNGES